MGRRHRAARPIPAPSSDRPDARAPSTDSGRLLATAVVVASVIATILFSLGTPYRPFPSDDVRFLREPQAWGHLRLFVAAVQALARPWTDAGAPGLDALLLLTVASNAVTAVAVGWLVRSLTRSTAAAFAALVGFSLSSWSIAYCFLATYAPMAAALSTVVVVLLSRANEIDAASPSASRRRRILLATAGLTSGGLLLVTSSAPVVWFSHGLLLLVLFAWRPPPGERRRIALYFVLPAVASIGTQLAVAWQPIAAHLRENAAARHMADAALKFGHAPATPAFAFLRIGLVEDPTMFVGFVGCVVFLPGILRGLDAVARPRMVGLLVVVLAQALTIEVLPFTKLARTYFPAYPVLVVVTIVGAWTARRTVPRSVAAAAFGVFVACSIAYGASEGWRMRASRTALPSALGRLGTQVDLFLDENDPHAPFIEAWLMRKPPRSSPGRMPHREGRELAYLVGPHGPGSGNSMLLFGTLRDYSFVADEALRGATKLELPYYGFVPQFLMEEEVSQALFFEGMTPSPRDPSCGLTLYSY